MAKWFMAAKRADFNEMSRKYQIDPVVARIIRNRDLTEDIEIEHFLHGDEKDMYSFSLLKDMDKAVDILSDKISDGQRIRVIGDYDVDGICATYILWKGLLTCGAKVDTVIPHRIRDGYGINEQLIEAAAADGIDTIVTCDNGIAAGEALSYGVERNMTCIVTDHHEIPYEEANGVRQYSIPQVDAVIDPKQEDCGYPYAGICGAAVAYKLVEGLFSRFAVSAGYKKELIELAGVATVCDVMELRDENRILVKTALQYMRDSANYGLQALIRVNQLEASKLSAYHLGYVIGPCINASGRLDTARIALELLQSASYDEAAPKAAHLKELNESRKEMTEQGIQMAIQIVEKDHLDQDKVMVVFLPKLHESLAGIVAGRIREKYGKPVFVLTRGIAAGIEDIKGSGRSIPAYHMYDEMTKCSSFFMKYGGHAMAAGLSMEEADIQFLRKRLNACCTLKPEDYEERILIDVPMPFSYVTENLVEQLSVLEPFGPGNEKPVFAQKNATFISGRKMGNGDMAKFEAAGETGKHYTLLLFRGLDQFEECVREKYGEEAVLQLYENGDSKGSAGQIILDVLYYPSVNEYRGRRSLQFIIQDYR